MNTQNRIDNLVKLASETGEKKKKKSNPGIAARAGAAVAGGLVGDAVGGAIANLGTKKLRQRINDHAGSLRYRAVSPSSLRRANRVYTKAIGKALLAKGVSGMAGLVVGSNAGLMALKAHHARKNKA